tara:strand:- start:2397 stop:3395 length:999 start_codon:yes stop_codon:yes gene_type:complete
MKIIVTGCFGFIGYNFINYLQENTKDEFYIYGIDSLESPCSQINAGNFKKKKNFEFIELNITNIDDLDFSKNNIDAVINFAAESHVDNSIRSPEKFIKSNVIGTSKIFQNSLQNNIENNIHISTDEVYGSSINDYFDEQEILNPSSPYSASKASAEMICKAFIKTYGMNINILRPANNYGIFQQPEKLIPYSIINLIKGNNIEIYGSGKNIRHWLHVQDTCNAIFKILVGNFENEVFNIGSGEYLSNLEISELILENFDFDQDRLEFIEDRPGHDFRYAVDISKLRDIGWSPKHTIKNSIEEIINWYKANDDWWKETFEIVKRNRLKRFEIS